MCAAVQQATLLDIARVLKPLLCGNVDVAGASSWVVDIPHLCPTFELERANLRVSWGCLLYDGEKIQTNPQFLCLDAPIKSYLQVESRGDSKYWNSSRLFGHGCLVPVNFR